MFKKWWQSPEGWLNLLLLVILFLLILSVLEAVNCEGDFVRDVIWYKCINVDISDRLLDN